MDGFVFFDHRVLQQYSSNSEQRLDGVCGIRHRVHTILFHSPDKILSNLESWIPVRPGSAPIAEDEDDEDDDEVALRLVELEVGREGDDGTRWCWKL